jgi:hypothetical protein
VYIEVAHADPGPIMKVPSGGNVDRRSSTTHFVSAHCWLGIDKKEILDCMVRASMCYEEDVSRIDTGCSSTVRVL